MFFLLFWQLLFVIDSNYLLDLASIYGLFVCFIYIYIYTFSHITFFLFSLAFWLNLSLNYRGTCLPSLEVVPMAS